MEEADPTLRSLVDRIPEGWSEVSYRNRRYGLNRTSRAGGRAVSLLAHELGGPDLISANVYLATDALLRPCEMPAAKVLDFLLGWTAPPGSTGPDRRRQPS